MSKQKLINNINGIIAEINLFNKSESKEVLNDYIGIFNNDIDKLIMKFLDINNNISSFGGIPVLKEIIGKLFDTCNIKVVKSTSCLVLKSEGVTIDHEFINKYQLENIMSVDDIKEEAFLLAERNNIDTYTLDLSESESEVS